MTFVVAVVLSPLAGAQSSSALENPIGKITSATGLLTIEHAVAVVVSANLQPGPAPAKLDDFVYQKDIVRTGPDGKATITFTDGTAFNLSSNAQMELNEFVYDPKGNSNSTMFSLVKGTFTFAAGKVATTGDMKFNTPVGTMGIRGTAPRVEIGNDGTVKFSTLVESKRGASAETQKTAPGTPRRAKRANNEGTVIPSSPQQAAAYNKLFRNEVTICRGC